MSLNLFSKHPLLILLIIGLTVRYLVWVSFGVDEPYMMENLFRGEDANYIDTLKENFSSILYYTHVKPVGSFIYDLLFYLTSASDRIFINKFIVISLLDSLTPLIIFVTLLRFNVGFTFCLILGILLSISLISWEYWRFGNHYNHINIFLITSFAFLIVNRLTRPSRWNDFFASILASLIMSMFSVMLVVAPLALFVGLSYQIKQILTLKFLKQLVATFALPSIVFIAIAGKNYIQFELFSPSSLGGENKASFVYTAGIPVPGMLEMAEANDFPDWWLWCFEQAIKNKAENDADYTAGFSKGCTGNAETREQSLTKILNYLKAYEQTKLIKIIEADLKTLKEAPWLLNFGVSTATPRFSIEYAKVSGKIYDAFMSEQPLMFLRQLIRANYKFLIQGSLWLSHDAYEGQLHPRPLWLKLIALTMVPILILGIIFSYLIFMLMIFKREMITNLLSPPLLYSTISLSLLAVVSAFFLTALHCCENPRLFMNIVPVYFVLGGIALHLLLQGMAKRPSKEKG